MEESKIISLLLAAIEFVIGGFAVVLWSNFKELKNETARQALVISASNDRASKELADHRLHTAENYTTKNDLAKAFESLTRSIDSVLATMNSRFDRMDSKLDSKMDKAIT